MDEPVSPETTKQAALLQQLTSVFTAIPFNRMLGLRLGAVTANHVTVHFEMKDELIGNFLIGILHGGVISSVLDMTGGIAAMSGAIHQNLDKEIQELVGIIGKTSTVDLHISYLRPGKGKNFTAKAWLTKSGKKVSFARMELLNQDETLIATGTATYLLR